MLSDTLKKILDPRSGVVHPSPQKDDNYWKTILDIEWKSGIHFVVVESSSRRGLTHFFVSRDNQFISPNYTHTKKNDPLFRRMQNVIDEIENGKYDNKKTMSEKITDFVTRKGLVSYMNNTKWRELFGSLGKNLPEINIQYKTIFENDSPDVFWDMSSDEYLGHMNPAQFEWFKIQAVITEYTYRGALIPADIKTIDMKDELLEILDRYSIPYEYDEKEQIFTVYGYK